MKLEDLHMNSKPKNIGLNDKKGYDEAIAELTVKHRNDENGFKRESLDVKLEYNKISRYEYEKQILDLKYAWMNDKDPDKVFYYKKKLKIELDYGYLSQVQYELRLNEINFVDDPEKLKLNKLDIMYRNNEMSKHEYHKEKFELEGKPYIYVKDSSFEYREDDEGNGSFDFGIEFEYNQSLIKQLKRQGFSGRNDDEIIDEWITRMYMDTAMTSGMISPAELVSQQFGEEVLTGDNLFIRKVATEDENVKAYS